MDVSRIAHGVYLAVCPETMDEKLFGGKLSTVLAGLEEEGAQGYRLYYLIEGNSGEPQWEPLDLKNHRHYHGEQRKQILHWFHACGAQLSHDGLHFMSNILGIKANRLRNALRPPETAHFQPFSNEAMTYLTYRFNQTRRRKESTAA